MIKISDYFERIHYTGATSATIENLRAIHRAHLYAVPFENLDIHLGRSIVLDEERLFHKIVRKRRGGFCFEQNGLFHRILTEMGYRVDRVEANVRGTNGDYDIPMNHMALIVHLDGVRWLTDVGFGASFMEPLRIDYREPQLQDGIAYRISHGDKHYYLESRDELGNWQIRYRFFDQPHGLHDFNDACFYMQTSPNSHFTQKRICSLARPDGRITLTDRLYIETRNGKRSERELPADVNIQDILLRDFGMELTSST